MRNLCSL